VPLVLIDHGFDTVKVWGRFVVAVIVAASGSGRCCSSFGLKNHWVHSLRAREEVCTLCVTVFYVCRWYATDHEFDIARYQGLGRHQRPSLPFKPHSGTHPSGRGRAGLTV
jgi:hypothetical protein